VGSLTSHSTACYGDSFTFNCSAVIRVRIIKLGQKSFMSVLQLSGHRTGIRYDSVYCCFRGRLIIHVAAFEARRLVGSRTQEFSFDTVHANCPMCSWARTCRSSCMTLHSGSSPGWGISVLFIRHLIVSVQQRNLT
jgi:hypothetical protein